MKNIVIASLIAALGGLAAAPQASAKNEGLAALGGFIGGVVVGASINDHDRDYDRRSDHRSGDYRPNYYTPVAPVCEPPRYGPPAPRGYWREVPVRSWVPARWVTSYDRRGRPVRVLEPGYYVTTTDRVWVGRG